MFSQSGWDLSGIRPGEAVFCGASPLGEVIRVERKRILVQIMRRGRSANFWVGLEWVATPIVIGVAVILIVPEDVVIATASISAE
jgi:hypothetical protein